MPMIDCLTLGPVDLTVNDGPAPPELLWRKNLGLLVYLARSPSGTRTRDHLTGLLWADKPDQSARHSLREAIRVIRKIVGEENLSTDHDQVRLAPDVVRLDVDTLAEHVESQEWEAAAALVRGEFMEGFSVPDTVEFEDWLASERSTWSRQSTEALTRWSHTQIERGQVRQALEAAERALNLEPSHELALGLAMRAAALRGDRAGALERFESHAARLAEFGTKPTEETAALAERIRQERSWQLDAAVPSVATEGAELRRAPLIGRDTELEKITDVWSRCMNEPSAHAIVIEAASGLGKTRLAEELRARARLDGAVVASIRAVEGDLDNPWSGCLGLARSGLDAAPGVAATAPDSLAAFAQHIPGWADRFGSGSSTNSLAVAFADVVGSITEEAPLALIVDDAHWIDRDSLLALLAVLRDHASRAVTVAITIDPTHPRSEVDDLRARLGRDTPGTSLHLEPLPTDAVRALTAWAVPSLAGDEVDRLARRIAIDSAGLPLLAVELLHAVALGMDIGTIEGAWPEPFRTLDHTLPGDLPDAVVAAIRVGYRRLSEDAQSALAAISVLEGVVSDETIGTVTALENAQRHAALDELEWQRWVTVDARGYSCVARIVREVVRRDMVTKGQRERMREAAKDAT